MITVLSKTKMNYAKVYCTPMQSLNLLWLHLSSHRITSIVNKIDNSIRRENLNPFLRCSPHTAFVYRFLQN